MWQGDGGYARGRNATGGVRAGARLREYVRMRAMPDSCVMGVA